MFGRQDPESHRSTPHGYTGRRPRPYSVRAPETEYLYMVWSGMVYSTCVSDTLGVLPVRFL